MKDHKFFYRNLNNDLNTFMDYLIQMEKDFLNGYVSGIPALYAKQVAETRTLGTGLSSLYNIFQFHNKEIHELLKSIRSMVKEACEYYEIDFKIQNFMVQGWFNINYNGVNRLNWHDHGIPGAPHFHGYYCVNAEPSITRYRIFNNPERIIENKNKNNQAILSEMGHPHSIDNWEWDGPRITIAYDIMRLEDLDAQDMRQHWIPLV